MSQYTIGKQTAAAGTDIVVTCPPRDVLIPVLEEVCVTTGATAQWLYVMSPLGITWTKGFSASGSGSVTLDTLSPINNPDGTPRAITAGDYIAVASPETGQFSGFKSRSLGTTSIDTAVTDTYHYTTEKVTPPPVLAGFDTNSFKLSDVDGISADPWGHMGIHLSALNVEQGATINSATLQVYGSGVDQELCDYTPYVQNVDDASAPTSFADITDKLAAGDSVTDYFFTDGEWHDIDVTDGVQALVNRGGWSSGNGINIYVELDDIGGTSNPNDCGFDKEGDANEPRLVVSAGNANEVQIPATTTDTPTGSLAYCYFSETDSLHTTLRIPANTTKVFRGLSRQGGVGTQLGKQSPVSSRGCPMQLVLTNDTNAAVLEYAVFKYVDLKSLDDQNVFGAPFGPSRKYFIVEN